MKKTVLLFLLFLILPHALTLSPQEQSLIKKHPLRCISTSQWAPFNLMEDRRLAGIGIDYWHLIQQKLHIKSPCTLAKNWSEVLYAIKHHTADITIATQNTQNRLSYASFSKPYARYPIVIVTKNDAGFIDDISLLKNKTIVVGKNYSVAEILKKQYPNLHVTYVETIDAALQSVDQERAFATIEILPVVAYKLNKEAFPDLKISGSLSSRFSVSLMIRKDYEILLPLINRAIDAITEKEKRSINKKWIVFKKKAMLPRSYFYLLLISSGALFLFFSIWLYLLKKEISGKDKVTEQLKTLVTIDSLTSTCNRYMFDITLDKEIELSKRHHYRLSLIFFDIDNFKQINDHYGHKTGDIILKALAKVASQSIRKSDTLCRWGGDEFIIILHNTEEETARKLADNLDLLIRSHSFTSGIALSCSFGVTSFRVGETREALMERIDRLLYAAKKKP